MSVKAAIQMRPRGLQKANRRVHRAALPTLNSSASEKRRRSSMSPMVGFRWSLREGGESALSGGEVGELCDSAETWTQAHDEGWGWSWSCLGAGKVLWASVARR